MSQEDSTDTDNVGVEGQDSTLIKDLRKQVKESAAKLKSYEAKDDAYNQVRASLTENLLMEAGYPKLKEDVLEKIEGIPSKEDITAFLEVRGLEVKAPGSEVSQDEPEGEPQPSVADVAGLGQQIASAAQRQPLDKFNAKLDATKNSDDIDAVMAEFGLRG